MTKVTWDDYVGDGVIKAIEVVKDIGGTDQINVLGFCVEGKQRGADEAFETTEVRRMCDNTVNANTVSRICFDYAINQA